MTTYSEQINEFRRETTAEGIKRLEDELGHF